MDLTDLIEEYLADHPELLDPGHDVAGECGDHSDSFVGRCRRAGLRADTILWTHTTRQAFVGPDGERHDWYYGCDHVIAWVDGCYVDFTARQFLPDADLPQISEGPHPGASHVWRP